MNLNASQRLATTIGVLKWVVVGVLSLLALVTAFVVGQASGFLGFVSFVVLALVALTAWVVYGWFQHTLGAQTATALNTAPRPVDTERTV